MGTAYTAMAPSMVTVSDTLQQGEYATDVRPTLFASGPGITVAHALPATVACSDATWLCSQNYGTSWTRRTMKTRPWETVTAVLLQPGCRLVMNSTKRASTKRRLICEQPTTNFGMLAPRTLFDQRL